MWVGTQKFTKLQNYGKTLHKVMRNFDLSEPKFMKNALKSLQNYDKSCQSFCFAVLSF